MNTEVPYMPGVANLHKIFDSMQKAGVPDAFGLDFLKDLGYTSSNDRAVIKILKYLGFLDNSGKPQPSYRDFMDGSRSKSVLAQRMRFAYDDLFLADKAAHQQTIERLKGWFKTKTGESDSVAAKVATTFKSLAAYATWSDEQLSEAKVEEPKGESASEPENLPKGKDLNVENLQRPIAIPFTYRIEINLPDTSNVETYRAIFRAIKEELIA